MTALAIQLVILTENSVIGNEMVADIDAAIAKGDCIGTAIDFVMFGRVEVDLSRK
jgi:hypothetical protein